MPNHPHKNLFDDLFCDIIAVLEKPTSVKERVSVGSFKERKANGVSFLF
jgi:hypothetical protein